MFFISVALVRTIDRSGADALPSGIHLAVAEVLAIAGLLIGARAWVCLFEEGPAPELRHGFYASQLGKYIPGGIWQTVALVGSASRSGAGVARSSVRLPVYMITTIAAGGTLGAALAVVGTSVPTFARWASLAGLLTLPLLGRRWMMAAVRLFSRLSKQPISDDAIPSRRAILRSYVFNLASVLTGSAAFAVLLGSFHTQVSSLEAVSGFCLAWIAGYAAVPVPSGIGVREAVLIGLFESGIEGPVVTAAVAQRIVLIVAELVVVVLSSTAQRRVRRP